jgi:hypothetical protein
MSEGAVAEAGNPPALGDSSPLVTIVDRVRLWEGPEGDSPGVRTESIEKEAASGEGEAGTKPETERARE